MGIAWNFFPLILQVLGENIWSEKIALIYELLHKADTYKDQIQLTVNIIER
jgi:hypothetical protein